MPSKGKLVARTFRIAPIKEQFVFLVETQHYAPELGALFSTVPHPVGMLVLRPAVEISSIVEIACVCHSSSVSSSSNERAECIRPLSPIPLVTCVLLFVYNTRLEVDGGHGRRNSKKVSM